MELLNKLVEEHGKKWSMLTNYFPGRTDNQLLRAWKAQKIGAIEETIEDTVEEAAGEQEEEEA